MADISKVIKEFRERIQTNLLYLLHSTHVGIKLLVELYQRQLLTEEEFENITSIHSNQDKANFLYTSLVNKYNDKDIESFLRALESSGNLQAFTLLHGMDDVGRLLERSDNNRVSANPLPGNPGTFGFKLGKVQIFDSEKEVGRGGSGKVFKGAYLTDNKVVAIKVIEEESIQKDKWKELEIVQDVVHPNIVQYFEFEFHEHKRLYALIMELAETDLDKWLKKDSLKPKALLKTVLVHISRGLQALHNQNIIHRDIKPSNILIFLGSEVVAKIADFGLSRIVLPNKTGIITQNAGYGTPGWMAPEQLKSKKRLTPAVDIFSFGLVVHFILMNRNHLYATSQSESEVVISCNILADKRITHESPQFSSFEYKELLMSMTNKYPTKRPKIEEIISHPLMSDCETVIIVEARSKPINGSTGTVYEKLHQKEDNIVRDKLVQMDMIDPDRWKELQVLRKVIHPNIVQYYSLETDGPPSAIAMELANSTLENWIHNGEPKSKTVLKSIMKQISSGLDALHSYSPQIIHGDIKPSNILILYGSEVIAKLTDFGLSRIMLPNKSGITTNNSGSFGWMSYEQLGVGDRLQITTAIDIFSLGLVFHFIITEGKHLFARSSSDANIFVTINIFRDEQFWNHNSNQFDLVEYQSFLKCLVKKEPSARPSIKSILNHPIMWTYEHGLQFIESVSMNLDKKNEPQNQHLRRRINDQFQDKWSSWDSKLCPVVKVYFDHTQRMLRKYNAAECTSLIDFIYDKRRNWGSWRKIPELTADKVFGKNGENYAKYFARRFPELIPMLFEFFQQATYRDNITHQLCPFFLNIKPDEFNV